MAETVNGGAKPSRLIIRLKIAALLSIALMLGAWFQNQVLDNYRESREAGERFVVRTDFLAFYTGGRFFLEGRMDELYDFGNQVAFQQTIRPGLTLDSFHPFLNPPCAAPLMAPFAAGSYAWGAVCWTAVQLAMLAGSVWLARRAFSFPRSLSAGETAVNALLFYPAVYSLLLVQNSFATLFFCTGFVYLLADRRDFAAGLAGSLLLYKPQYIVLAALPALAKFRWRALAGLAVGGAAHLAAGFWTGAEAMRDYAALAPELPDIIRIGGGYDYNVWAVHSWFGFFSLLLDHWSMAAADALTLLVGTATLGLLVWHWKGIPWEPASAAWRFSMAGSLALVLPLSPHLFTYDLSLLLLPMAIAWSAAIGGESAAAGAGRLFYLTAALYFLGWIGMFITKYQIMAFGAMGGPAMAAQFSTAAIALWGLEALRRAKRQVI